MRSKQNLNDLISASNASVSDMPPFQEEEKKFSNEEMLKHELLMDALDINSDAGSNKLNPSFLLPIAESEADDLLENDQENFVQDQIKNLDY